jgi:hypothetical protein
MKQKNGETQAEDLSAFELSRAPNNTNPPSVGRITSPTVIEPSINCQSPGNTVVGGTKAVTPPGPVAGCVHAPTNSAHQQRPGLAIAAPVPGPLQHISSSSIC